MANKPSLKSIRSVFDDRLSSSLGLYSYAEEIAKGTWESITGREPLHPRQAQKIVALSFMDIVAGWEDFVEGSFVRYLAGATSPNGYRPSMRCGYAKSIPHAYQLASGNPAFKIGSHYFQSNSWRDVVEAAKVFYENGEPFSLLSPFQKEKLADASKIRNRIAHTSDKCKKEFGVVARQCVPNVHQGYSAGQLLIYKSNKGFGRSAPTQSYFRHYLSLFEDLAEVICPKKETGT